MATSCLVVDSWIAWEGRVGVGSTIPFFFVVETIIEYSIAGNFNGAEYSTIIINEHASNIFVKGSSLRI